MIKKILLFVLVMFPVMIFAQEKIAYINYADVITAMPEYKIMVDSLEKDASAYDADLKQMSEDYYKKYSELIAKQDSLNENIKLRKQQEIQDLGVNIENFQKFTAEEYKKTEQALFMPIQSKAQRAINEVGTENNFLYIIPNSPELLLYISPNAVDATPMVKKKLGLQ